MNCRIWTYIVVVLIFVLPVCTVLAIKFDAQSELRGSACVKKCVDVPRTVGSCDGGGDDCAEDGCGTYQTWTESHCVDANGPLKRCDNGYAYTAVESITCFCDPVWNFCDEKLPIWAILFLPQCVNETPC